MTDAIHRREFIGRTAFGAAAAGLATSAIGRADDKPSQRVVVGVMGMSRGRSLATQFAQQAGVEVRYVCDVDSKRAGTAAEAVEKTGAAKPQAIGDFQQILDDDEVDALVCAAPNHWHAPATILACAAGKHVYVEKPCSQNPREGEMMVEAARKYRRAVQMGTQRRSGPKVIAAMELLHSGEIGRVYASRAYHSGARGTIGKGKPADVPENLNYDLWQGPAPRVPYVDNRVHYNWHWLWHWGNGELGNNGVHTLDLCRWGLDADYPIRVTSNGGRYRFDDDQQTPDTHNVSFEFEDRKMVTWQGMSCNRHNSDFVVFYGEKGSLELTGSGHYTVYDAADKVVRSENGTRGDTEHIVDFLSAIRDDKPTRLNAEIEEGHKSTLLCHLGNIAQRTGRTLNCDARSGHIIGDPKAMTLWQRDYEPGWEPRV